jgi:hypothetical protein
MIRAMNPRRPEYVEGSEAATRFQNAMKSLVAIPHTEIMRREAEYKKQSEANPHRRGPKRKRQTG